MQIYQKNGPLWFPRSTQSVTEAHIFGTTDVNIEYFDYAPKTRMLPTTPHVRKGDARSHEKHKEFLGLQGFFAKKTIRGGHMPVNECLILAAGNGSRIASVSGGVPKPLVPLLRHTTSRTCHDVVSGSRNRKFVIVVGYRADLIRRWFAERSFEGISVTLIENPDYHKANGVSALAAKEELHNPFLLLMSDHIFEPKTAKALLQQPLADDEVILAVDHNVDRVFDLDDATKVKCEGNHIVDIGKDLASSTTRSIQECFCAARRSSTGSNQQRKTETVRCRTACANLAASGN